MDAVQERIDGFLWHTPPDAPLPRRVLVAVARFFYGLSREIGRGDLTLRAMGLVYATLLSMVPLLAVSFSMLKAFGAHNQIEPMLQQMVLPLGDKGTELVDRIIGFVDNVNAGALGGAGLAVLIWTVVSLLQKVEDAFNHVWRVNQPRRLSRKFSDYLSVLTIGPVLVFAALGTTASVLNNRFVQQMLEIEPFGTLIVELTKLVPLLLIIVAFTFFYVFITNTRVRLVPALIGATVAGVLWQMVGYGFGLFVKTSGTHAVIYSSFAILILFLIWLQLSWLTLLLGSQVAFFVQNPRALRYGRHPPRLSNLEQERASLEILTEAAARHHDGTRPVTASELAAGTGLAEETIYDLAEQLRDRGYLEKVAGSRFATWVLGREAETVLLSELLRAIRQGGRSRTLEVGSEVVQKLLKDVDQAVENDLQGLTLKDLALQRGSRFPQQNDWQDDAADDAESDRTNAAA